jgi:hypothetical protein
MKTREKLAFTKRPSAGKPFARRSDPTRWIVAGLVLLALIGIGAMETNVLMFRGGKDLMRALLEAGAFVLAAALPAGYLVYRFWFAERSFMKPIKGWNAGAVDMDDDWGHSSRSDLFADGYTAGPSGIGLYYGGLKSDDSYED